MSSSSEDFFQNFTNISDINTPKKAHKNTSSYHVSNIDEELIDIFSDTKIYPLTKKLLKLSGKKKIVLPSNNSKTRKMTPSIIQN
jgi:hypothetical protein